MQLLGAAFAANTMLYPEIDTPMLLLGTDSDQMVKTLAA